MARFTLSQLDTKPAAINLTDSDLLFSTIGTTGSTLSSVRISLKQVIDYGLNQYTDQNPFNVSKGLSATVSTDNHIQLKDLPNSDPGFPGALYYQTSTQLGLDSLTSDDTVRFVIMSQ